MATRLMFKLLIMSANLGRIRTERAKTGLARVGEGGCAGEGVSDSEDEEDPETLKCYWAAKINVDGTKKVR